MKVMGYGDNVVDRYVNKKIMFPGGNAVNFAVYAKEIGLESSYLGSFGDDAEADHVIASLKDVGVDLTFARRVFGAATERCDVNLVDGDRVFVGDDMRPNLQPQPLLSERDLAFLEQFDLIHSGCYAGTNGEMFKLKELPALVTFDFAVEPEFKTDEFLNDVCPYIDMALFSAEDMTPEEVAALQEKVIGLGTKYILVTNGTKGQALYDGETYYEGCVELVEPVDTMGAGDSFFAAFVCDLLKRGWKKGEKLTEEMVRDAFRFAAHFSAQNCLRDGGFGYGTAMIED